MQRYGLNIWCCNLRGWVDPQEGSHSLSHLEVQRKKRRKKMSQHRIVLIQRRTSIIDQCIMTQKYSWLTSLHPVTLLSPRRQQSSQRCLLFTRRSVQKYGKQWAARWRDKGWKITSLARWLGCLRHRRWGHCVGVCVGGRPEAGWCVWVLFWCHLGC